MLTFNELNILFERYQLLWNAYSVLNNIDGMHRYGIKQDRVLRLMARSCRYKIN